MVSLGYILIHGYGLAPWVWNRTVGNLTRPAVATPRAAETMPLTTISLADCAQMVGWVMNTAEFENIIVVAHGLGGVIAPYVAYLYPGRVKCLVYLGGCVPAEGDNALQTMSLKSRWLLALQTQLWARGISWPQPWLTKLLRHNPSHDCDPTTLERLQRAGHYPEPPALFFEPVTYAYVPAVPTTYIQLTQDQGAWPPAVQAQMALQAQAKLLPFSSGHLPMLSRPDDLAEVLNNIALEVTPPLNGNYPR